MQTTKKSCSTSSMVTLIVAVTFAAGLGASSAQAQVARVSAAQRITEKRTGDAGAWQKVGTGAGLNAEDSLRTGKRSKADVKFNDGSLLRLGQISTVSIKSTTDVQVVGGQVMAVRLSRGRVLAGTAVGEITGSIAIVRLNADGSSTWALHNGNMSVTTPRATIVLRPGKSVTARADGSLTTIFNVAPLAYQGGSLHSELTTPPQQSIPYAGSPTNLREKYDPSRLTLDENRPVTQNPAVVENNSNPFHGPTPPRPTPGAGGSPFPTPFPTGPSPVPTPFPTLPPQEFSRVAKGIYTPSGLGVSPRVARQVAGNVTPEQAQAANTANAAQQAADLATTDAEKHFEEGENQAIGSGSGADVMLLGALTAGNGEGQAYGGRLHAFSADGRWFIDLAATPLRLRFKPRGAAGYTTTDLSAISNATITYRNARGEFQIGRQRFIEGPTQASIFGSLIRQGAREVMDAVRISPNIGENRTLDLAYLYDAFPHNLPYRVSGAQRGWYGRLGAQTSFGNFGLNMLDYRNTGIPSTTGVTLDFALPIWRDQVEFYGEVGRDTFRRRLTTTGLTFPGLYDRTDFDVYLEYARLRGSSTLGGPPNELALRVYRKFGNNINLVAGVSKFSGFKTSYTLGMSIGHRLTRGDQY